MGSSAGARLYSATVHVLAIVGAASLIAFGFHLIAPANGGAAASSPRELATTTVRRDPMLALAMISGPAHSRGPVAVHAALARGDGARWRPSNRTAGVIAAPAESDPPLLHLDPVDQVLNASPDPARPVRGRDESGIAAPDGAQLQHGGDSGAGDSESRGLRRLAAQATPPQASGDAARPLLVLADAPEVRADQPLLPGFSDAAAASGAARPQDDPATASDATAQDRSPGDARDSGTAGPAGGDNAGGLAPPDPDARDGGAQ
jgi:hypothetical protein